MVKNKSLIFKRIGLFAFALIFVFLGICTFASNASAVVGNTTYPPQYFPVVMFDYCYAVNGTGNRYELDWPLNYFTEAGYNFPVSYSYINSNFGFTSTTTMDNLGGIPFAYRARNTVDTSVNFADGTGRSFNLFTYELAWSSVLNALGQYNIWFGNGGYNFDVSIDFSLVEVIIDTSSVTGENYYTTQTSQELSAEYAAELTLMYDNVERYVFDLAWYIQDMISDHFTGSAFLIKNLNVRLFNVESDADLASTGGDVIHVNTDVYRLVDSDQGNMPSPFTGQDWFDHQALVKGDTIVNEGDIVVMEPPTNWLDWIADILDAFLNINLFGLFSFGDLLWAVIGIGLFMLFIKMFGGSG